MGVVIEPLDTECSFDQFDCGSPPLNEFLQRHAVVNQKRRLSSTFVVYDNTDSLKDVIGYYSLCSAEVSRAELANKLSRSLPYQAVPATKLGRLAVDRRAQGQGLGTELLAHAIGIAYKESSVIGSYAIVVDAKDEKAAEFYQKFGFIAQKSHPLQLYLPMKVVAKLQEAHAPLLSS